MLEFDKNMWTPIAKNEGKEALQFEIFLCVKTVREQTNHRRINKSISVCCSFRNASLHAQLNTPFIPGLGLH